MTPKEVLALIREKDVKAVDLRFMDFPGHPKGPLELKQIEEVFINRAPIFHLHVGGQVIRTTAEHPFYVQGKGWVDAHLLQIGDNLVNHASQVLAVEEVLDIGEVETVYNFRVADHRTYFVGGPEAGYAVWAHNAECTVVVRHRGGNRQVTTADGHRWHLPAGKTGSAIPNADPIGNQLQAAANNAASQWRAAGQGANRWTNNLLSEAEKRAIQEALDGPKSQRWRAYLLEREARGRWVEDQVRNQANALDWRLSWNRSGVDAINLDNPSIKYEILSGTASKMARHARRMADVAYRMISF